MEVRPLTKEDITGSAELIAKAYNGPPWNFQWTTERAEKYLHELFNAPRFAGFCISEDGKIAAALFGHAKTWWINDILMIDELFVSPGRQGKGYGQALMNAARQYCMDNNIGSITLITHKYMPAVSFYEKNKFLQAEQYVLMFNEN
jgi:aminoglycoside 6'-N-acetyltransferase I